MKLFSVRVRALPGADGMRVYLARLVAEAAGIGEDAAVALLARAPVSVRGLREEDARAIVAYCTQTKGIAEVKPSGDRFYAFDPKSAARGNQAFRVFEQADRVVRFGDEKETLPSAAKAIERFQLRGRELKERGLLLADSAHEAHLAVVARSAEIEARCHAPGDEGCRVYADWLQEQGDPRGEVLAVAHALAAAPPGPERATLEKRERELVRENRQHLLGAIADSPFLSLELRGGWISDAEVFLQRERRAIDDLRLRELVGALLALPAAKLLSSYACSDFDSQRALGAMLALGVPRTLRRASFGPKGFDSRTSPFVDPSPLIERAPLLEELAFTSQSLVVDAIPAERMRRLALTGETGVRVVKKLASHDWPRLESLELKWNASSEYAPADEEPSRADWERCFAARFPALRSLTLHWQPRMSNALAALAESPVVRTLETLHVSGPDEPSGDVLLKRAGDFLHLKRLAVGGWVGRHEAELRNVFGATLEIVR